MAHEVRYKVRPGQWELPVKEQWPVFTPQPRSSTEAGKAVTEIIDKYNPELIVLVKQHED